MVTFAVKLAPRSFGSLHFVTVAQDDILGGNLFENQYLTYKKDACKRVLCYFIPLR